MAFVKETIQLNGSTLTLETGKIAQQAGGAVVASLADTVVLVTATGAKEERVGGDFLPLTVDYQEKMFAAGRIPGGFFKREGRLRDAETLTSRIIDRSIRPLLPETWRKDIQVIATVLSADNKHHPDAMSLTAASAALTLSDIPFQGPIAGVRVARVDGALIAYPTMEQEDKADIDIIVAASAEAIVMVEGGASEVSEAALIDALLFAHRQAQPLIEAQLRMAAQAGKPKQQVVTRAVDQALAAQVRELAMPHIERAYGIKQKLPRYAALDEGKKALLAALTARDPALAERKAEVSAIWGDLRYDYVRAMILDKQHRIDGRGLADIRPIECEVGVLPRVHGSALFTRGETQALVTVTLGTRTDEQRIDNLLGDTFKRLMLHYNFPPYSVGETKPLRSPGRREIGHGALAERSITPILQLDDKVFPYTVRIVSEILASNGSSSMATVCGTSLALMDAGAPMTGPVAGVAMGLIKEGERMAILSDILGDEDHLGDMDFKVAGTAKGVTAIQMDIKVTGIDRAVLERALEQARLGRLHILGEMNKALGATRTELSPYAPRFTTYKISVDKIKDVIGPGGKIIKEIVAKSGCQIDVEEDGTIHIAAIDPTKAQIALDMIKAVTAMPEIGQYYVGKVVRVVDFGAFIEIFPGTDGLCHISELENKRVRQVTDVVKEGDEVLVKVIDVDERSGKIRLSRREALDKNIDDFRKKKA